MDPLARIASTDLLHPTFRLLVASLQARLQAASLPLAPFETARTPERQVDLYAQGRVQGRGRLGHPHTWAKAWHSYHQYGLAVDMVWQVDGRWSWDPPTGLTNGWGRYQAVAAQLGLQAVRDRAGEIMEWPHVQMAWPEVKLLAGEYPPSTDPVWVSWFNQQVARWGANPQTVDGIQHPGGPPAYLPGDHRPAFPEA